MSQTDGKQTGDQPVKAGTVFFVDDDDRLRTVTCRLLQARGFEVLEADSAERAFELLEAHEGSVDVLLMDINLPDGWGASVAQRLRDSHPEMAVVYTTGYADVDPILSSALRDAEYVIKKPFSTDELVAVLAKAIAGRGGSAGAGAEAV